jgi:hypothetical protein
MSIFVQIAAYRDELLSSTISDLIEKASSPSELRIVVCNQFHPDDEFNKELDLFRSDSRIEFIDIPYDQSKGACWARNLVQQHYNGEDYTLQIDAHMRFAYEWDLVLIRMLTQLQDTGYPRPILTTYPAPFFPETFEVKEVAPNMIILISFDTNGGLPEVWPEEIPGWKDLSMPVPARFYAAGFSFTLGRFCEDVPHDPNIYFLGEEINIAVRAYTHGYDLFHPHMNVLWHYYTRAKSAKHWDDHRSIDVRHRRALLRLNRLMDPKLDAVTSGLGIFGLGNERTLRQYEQYAGILLQEQKAQEYTYEQMPPPNPGKYAREEDWLNSFSSRVNDSLTIPKYALKDKEFDSAILTFKANGQACHQLNLSDEEISAMISSATDHRIKLRFSVKHLPDSWELSVHTTTKGWVKKTAGVMPAFNTSMSAFSLNNCHML